MDETRFDHSDVPSLRAIFGGAKDFGLTEDEVWRTVDESMRDVGGDGSVYELLEELNGALAQAVLAKQRRTLSAEDGRAGSPEKESRRKKRGILSRNRS